MKTIVKKNEQGRFEVWTLNEPGKEGRIIATFAVEIEAESFSSGMNKTAADVDPKGYLLSEFSAGDTATIKDVEIFAVGRWRGVNSPAEGDKYTREDLEAMVSAFNAKVVDPFVKLTHGADNDQPEIGRVSNLRVIGEKLVGDLVGVPRSLRDFMKETGAFARRSAEVIWGLKDKAGKTWSRVLKAVALLAPGQVPAVGALAEGYKFEAVYSYESKVEGGETDMELKDLLKKYNVQTVEELFSLIDNGRMSAEKVKSFEADMIKVRRQSWDQFIADQKKRGAVIPAIEGIINSLYEAVEPLKEERSYTIGTESKKGDAVELLKAFITGLPNIVNMKEQSREGDKDHQYDDEKKASVEVERLAKVYISEGKAKDYAAGLDLVRKQNPDLWKKYASGK